MTASDTTRFSGSLTARRDSPVGVVGLESHMGHAFAANLVADGYQVFVYDQEPERAATLIGASAAARLGDLAACNLVLTSLPDDDALAEVALGPEGLAAILKPGPFTFPRAPSARGCLAGSLKSMRGTGKAILQHRSSGTRILPGQGSSSYSAPSTRFMLRARPLLETRSASVRDRRRRRIGKPRQACRQRPYRNHSRMHGRGFGADAERRCRRPPRLRCPDQFAVQFPGPQELWPKDRRWSLHPARIDGTARDPEGFAACTRACLQLRRMAAQARWTAARKILASLS